MTVRAAVGPGEFSSEALDEHRHKTGSFNCGETDLNLWLAKSAGHAARMNTARTFVWTADSDDVVAYYALSAHQLASEEVPARVARGGPRSIPAVLIGKLALARDLHGQGLGSELLLDALERVVLANQQGPAARVVLVDALNESAADFYRHHGFSAVPGRPLRLVQKMSAIESSLGLAA